MGMRKRSMERLPDPRRKKRKRQRSSSKSSRSPEQGIRKRRKKRNISQSETEVILKKQIEILNFKLDVLYEKVMNQTQIVSQELNQINDKLSSNVGGTDEAVNRYRICTIM